MQQGGVCKQRKKRRKLLQKRKKKSSGVQDYLGIAKQLLDTIYFYNGKMFGLRGQPKKLNWQCS